MNPRSLADGLLYDFSTSAFPVLPQTSRLLPSGPGVPAQLLSPGVPEHSAGVGHPQKQQVIRVRNIWSRQFVLRTAGF